MHGLMNRAVQCFVRDTYGPKAWADVVFRADIGFDNFEAMLSYDDQTTFCVLDTICEMRAKPRDALLEDIGTYLVSHPNVEALRRLLRFGGVTFVDFLLSLNDLPDRAKLAVTDLELPRLELWGYATDRFSLTVISNHAGFGNVMVGLLQAMADDYGVLAVMTFKGRAQNSETIDISILETCFAEGRSFDLAGPVRRP